MKEKQIFIHSLFRTGSTYLWSKFRQDDRYCCYYEPFHPCFQDVTPENIGNILTTDFKAVHHPSLDKYYLHEYRRMLNSQCPGLPSFRKSFIFDEFCHITDNPGALKYINHLIENCENRIPVFQFNRSAGRTRWFKRNFPQALNLYLFRNPRDQWQSYWELFQRTEYGMFFVMDLLTASLNADAEPFRPLAEYLPLFKFNAGNYQEEENFYSLVLRSYGEEERYLVFYYIWFWALLNNVLNADVCININRLSDSAGYRSGLQDRLLCNGLVRLDFDDAHISEYPEYRLPVSRLKQIEKTARQLVLQLFDQKGIQLFFRKFSVEDRNYLEFSSAEFEELRQAESPEIPEQSASRIVESVIHALREQRPRLRIHPDGNHYNAKETNGIPDWERDGPEPAKDSSLHRRIIRRFRLKFSRLFRKGIRNNQSKAERIHSQERSNP